MKLIRSILYPDWEKTCNLIYTSNNHCCSMNQSRYWSWTFHSVWQPNMQWEHCTLTSTTNKHQEQCRRQQPRIFSCNRSQLTDKIRVSIQVIIKCSNVVAKEQDTNQEEQVCKTSYDESFL